MHEEVTTWLSSECFYIWCPPSSGATGLFLWLEEALCLTLQGEEDHMYTPKTFESDIRIEKENRSLEHLRRRKCGGCFESEKQAEADVSSDPV